MQTSNEFPQPLLVALCTNLFDALGTARDADEAMKQIDEVLRLFAGPVTFSININVTTSDDPPNEIQLQRYYSSHRGQFPVQGRKRKTLTHWTDTLFAQGRVFVAEGAHSLAQVFDDYDRMAEMGLNACINVPILRGNACVATFNVFGQRGSWHAHEVLAVRMLALLAARWIEPAPKLHYSLGNQVSNCCS
ncbi:GAF domain-containing protein [Variovorax ginsengisoli]|uniref:GAF domain-containing protein n=1 Tax=Variovorax ginsengisoli TaxID=363844 RepID=A0ABT8SIA0_9BURK|nr:GAF domain-containing protein [Variovorax ginsengisoli]MDN8618944.1 GAF domain-containing protein [Variovorax ginsengisoli]MDO1538114.1 GAF domain-containing protein [Variovorax ginsengisoli]